MTKHRCRSKSHNEPDPFDREREQPPNVLDLINAGMGGDGRFRAVSSEGSEIEIHVDLTGKLVLTIEHGYTVQYWALEQGHE